MLLTMAALVAAAIVTSIALFGDVSAGLGRFQDEVMPNLVESSEIVETSGELGENLSGLLIAADAGEMSDSYGQATAAVDRLRASAGDLDGEEAEMMRATVDRVATHLSDVADARRDDIAFDAVTLDGSDALGAAVAQGAARVVEIYDAAHGRLLNGEIGDTGARRTLEAMDRAANLERLLGEIQSLVLTGASADSVANVEAAQAEADGLVARITSLAEIFSDPAIDAAVAQIAALTNPADGILAARRKVLAARQTADAASRLAAAEVGSATALARELGHEAMSEITGASGRLEAAANGGRRTMLAIAGGSVVALLLACIAAAVVIVRPLLSVTQVTERLATGDLSPVVGFERQRGEIGRMAAALTVFRNGMIERQRLEEEDRRREAEEIRRKADAERAAMERAQEEQARRAKAEAAERERETAESRKREALRADAEAERQARAAEQQRVVEALAGGMKHLAGGDLTVRLTETFPESYEALRRDFNAAVGNLSELIGQIAICAHTIDTSSSEISAASNQLSRRTENSAATLEQTAAALNELTASVSSAAEGASHANDVAHATNTEATTSREIVGEAVSAMSEIEESSRNIARIVDVIDGIAFQTNLLALNAGVEAARAGDAGRGFAVVASEVRELAQRSSQAAREINGLISTSNGQVDRGVKMVNEAGSVLQSIISGVAEITKNVGEIAASAQEQANGIKEINVATTQLDRTMQQNAAMTEETTAASDLLQQESHKMRDMIRKFRTAEDASDATPKLRSA
ncbi:methyl-accepting chemotaxis protein [Roseivivax sediminis]|nr:methyl-accepting chemotaxis protein [Roseivivax sediminis]